MYIIDKNGIQHDSDKYTVLPCGEVTTHDETRYAQEFNRTHVAMKNGDCKYGNCATCMYKRTPGRDSGMYGHTYCACSRKS